MPPRAKSREVVMRCLLEVRGLGDALMLRMYFAESGFSETQLESRDVAVAVIVDEAGRRPSALRIDEETPVYISSLTFKAPCYP
jgi:hypothetical protein